MVKQTDLVNSVADHNGVPLTDLLVTFLAFLTRVAYLGEDHRVEDDDVMTAILTTSAGF